MPALTVWRFSSPFGADEAELRVKMLRERGAVVVHDAATVVWMPGDARPRVRQLRHMRGSDALSGGVWGALVGAALMLPVAGAVVGAAVGVLHSSGIDDGFIAGLREQLRPGTSAILLLTSDADLDEVRRTFPFEGAELLHAELDPEGAARLRELLDERGEPDP